MSELMDLGGKYTQQARSLHVESSGWIRGHHVPGAIHAARTRARLYDVSPSKSSLRMYYESLLKLEREIEMYYHMMAQFRIKLTRIANETLADLEAMDEDKNLYTSADWAVIGPDEDEETWLQRRKDLYR